MPVAYEPPVEEIKADYERLCKSGHNVGGSRYLYCTVFTSSIIKSEDESLAWDEKIARDQGVDFKDGFVKFMDEVVANSTGEYIDLDDLLL